MVDSSGRISEEKKLSLSVRYLLDEGIMLLKDGTNSASKFAPHLISNEEAEQFDLSLLSKVILVTCLCSPRWLSTLLKVFLHFIFDNLVSR